MESDSTGAPPRAKKRSAAVVVIVSILMILIILFAVVPLMRQIYRAGQAQTNPPAARP